MSERLSPEEYRQLENIPDPGSNEHFFLLDAHEGEDYIDSLARERLSSQPNPELLEQIKLEHALELHREAMQARGEQIFYGALALDTGDEKDIKLFYENRERFRKTIDRKRELLGREAYLSVGRDYTMRENIDRWWPKDAEDWSEKWGQGVSSATQKWVEELPKLKTFGKESGLKDYEDRVHFWGRQEGAKAFAKAAVKHGFLSQGKQILEILSKDFNDAEAKNLLDQLE